MNKWYLIDSNTSPNMMGGFEDEPFVDFKQDAFMESLQTELASTVILYNYDLSVSKKMRCIIQNNTASTQLKSIERTILFPIGTVKAGMYIFFENCYWLITGFPGNNKIYEKVTATLCQYKLRWQNERGQIIERWCNLTSASKYDVGENGNHTIILTSNNYTILVPDDEESINLDRKRVFIDRNKKNPNKVFRITRNDDSLYYYGEHGGVLSLIADKTELNLKTDNLHLMICDYKKPTFSPFHKKPIDNEIQITAKILYKGKNELKAGGNYKTFTGLFEPTNEFNSSIGQWEIIAIDELLPYIKYTITDNVIKIKVTDDEFVIGGKVRIIFSNTNSSISTYIDLDIVNSF